MDEHLDCVLCGGSIEPGEAWMADTAEAQIAHAGCVYRDETDPVHSVAWEPQERTAG